MLVLALFVCFYLLSSPAGLYFSSSYLSLLNVGVVGTCHDVWLSHLSRLCLPASLSPPLLPLSLSPAPTLSGFFVVVLHYTVWIYISFLTVDITVWACILYLTGWIYISRFILWACILYLTSWMCISTLHSVEMHFILHSMDTYLYLTRWKFHVTQTLHFFYTFLGK